MKLKMILASHNKNKYLEIANIMNNYPIQLISLENYPEIKEIIENGSSLKENALIKASLTELVEQLLEYKRFKEAGDEMHLLHAEHGRHYSRGYLQKYDFKNKESTNEDFSLFSLSKIFHELMVTLPSDLPYSVNMDPVNVDEQIMFVIQQFKNSNRMLFHDLIPLLKTRLKIIIPNK